MGSSIILLKIGFVVCLAFIFYFIYKNFIKPVKTFKDFISRVVNFETVFMKKKANEVRIKALELPELSDRERHSILYHIGMYYYNRKEYEQAAPYFTKAVELIIHENFCYDKGFAKVIQCYLHAGQKESAEELYNNLLSRQSYDPTFKKLLDFSDVFERQENWLT